MRKTNIGVVVTFLLVIAGAFLFFVLVPPSGKKDGSETNGQKSGSLHKQNKTGGSPAPGLRTSERPVEEMVNSATVESYKIVPRTQAKIVGRKYVEKKQMKIVGGWRLPDEQPLLELRFRKRSGEGIAKPCHMEHIQIYGFYPSRHILSGSTELSSVHIDDGEKVAVVRFLLFDAQKMPNNPSKGLIMGRTYRLDLTLEGYHYMHNPDASGTVILKVPRDIKPGEMAVMVVDVNKRFDMVEYETKRKRTSLSIHLTADLSRRAEFLLLRESSEDWIANYHEFPVQGKNVECWVKKMGGELALVRKKNYAHVLCYKSSVKNQTIKLPEDADIVVRDKDLVRFRLKVPQSQTSARTEGIGLFYDQDDKIPLAATEYDQFPDTVELEFAPGTYFVGSWIGGDRQILGQVTVEKTDSGEVLTVGPVKD